MYNFVKEAFGG
jgi:dynein heavy chain 2, cytosolic